MSALLSFQDIIDRLKKFWASKGCVLLESYDMEMGAGTFHPTTTLGALGKDPRRVAYVQPCRRPGDGRYGENPNRFSKYYQFQVLLKPAPEDSQALYLESLKSLGLLLEEHDIRFVEDDWESPTLGAWGLGWEVWCDGMEISQFTYFQQMCALACDPVSTEITYGLERLAMYIQKQGNGFCLKYNEEGARYGDLCGRFEREFSSYSFEVARTSKLFSHFSDHLEEGHLLVEKDLALPAYDQCIKASHVFNLLDARGVISTAQRQRFIQDIRQLAKHIGVAYLKKGEGFS